MKPYLKRQKNDATDADFSAWIGLVAKQHSSGEQEQAGQYQQTILFSGKDG